MSINLGCGGWLLLVLLCVCRSAMIQSSQTTESVRAETAAVKPLAAETDQGAGEKVPVSGVGPTVAPDQPQQQQHVRVSRRSPQQETIELMKERSSRWVGSAPFDRWTEQDDEPDWVDGQWPRRISPSTSRITSWSWPELTNQIGVSSEDDLTDGDDLRSEGASGTAGSRSVDRLNWREAQLARLHGLGPAEIQALSSWQQRFKVDPPLVKRFKHPASPETSPAAPPLSNYQPWSPPAENRSPVGPDRINRTNDSPWWSKRSFSSSSNNNNNSPVNGNSKGPNGNREGRGFKDKNSRNGNDPTSKGSKGKSRKQQQQQQQQQQQESSAASGLDSPSRDKDRLAQLPSTVDGVSRINRNLAAQFLLRSPRENRQYDVPIIECPPAEDGMERFACPSPDLMSRYRCIDDHVLCDGFIDCPGGEDEDGQACMFYKTMKAHLDLVADALLRWVRGR